MFMWQSRRPNRNQRATGNERREAGNRHKERIYSYQSEGGVIVIADGTQIVINVSRSRIGCFSFLFAPRCHPPPLAGAALSCSFNADFPRDLESRLLKIASDRSLALLPPGR